MTLSNFTDRELRQELRKRKKKYQVQRRKVRGLDKRKKGMGCRIGDRDFAAMEARDFQDPGSYIRRDGSEKLVGEDWKRRIQELERRSGMRCEYFPAEFGRCWATATDPHHKIKRSVRRDDRLSNLMHLCRPHHEALDPRKIRSGKVGA